MYNILQTYRLINYDDNMSLLYHDLKKFLIQKFGSAEIVFQHNERIVFIHDDQDFFLSKEFPGFTLYNLQLILRELDISNCFCVIVTNLPNYSKYTQLAQQMLTTDDHPISHVTTPSLVLEGFDPIDIDINANSIIKSFTVLSRQSRFHRSYFMARLFDRKLQDDGQVSYSNILTNNSNLTNKNPESAADCPCHFLYADPFTRTNPEILIHNKVYQNQVAEFQKNIKSYKNFTEQFDVKNKNNAILNQPKLLQNSLIYVALETSVNSAEAFLSTISFKGIATKRPFIILGEAGCIRYLKTLGFKTFDGFWSEDYDGIENFEQRVEAILDILGSFSKKSCQELQEIGTSMTDILEYNFVHLKKTYLNKTLSDLV